MATNEFPSHSGRVAILKLVTRMCNSPTLPPKTNHSLLSHLSTKAGAATHPIMMVVLVDSGLNHFHVLLAVHLLAQNVTCGVVPHVQHVRRVVNAVAGQKLSQILSRRLHSVRWLAKRQRVVVVGYLGIQDII